MIWHISQKKVKKKKETKKKKKKGSSFTHINHDTVRVGSQIPVVGVTGGAPGWPRALKLLGAAK